MVDPAVIETRLIKLDGYLRGLRPFQHIPLPEYLADSNMQMIVERRLQLAIQACIDIANHLVARLGSRLPEEQENVFAVLGEEGILPPETALRLVGTVRFRNILVHDYLSLDKIGDGGWVHDAAVTLGSSGAAPHAATFGGVDGQLQRSPDSPKVRPPPARTGSAIWRRTIARSPTPPELSKLKY